MFGFGGKAAGHHGMRRRVPLSECEAGFCGIVVDNLGTRAMEMGFYPGAFVRVLNNGAADTALVVLAGECRFVVPREIAQTVLVRRRRDGMRWRWRRGGH